MCKKRYPSSLQRIVIAVLLPASYCSADVFFVNNAADSGPGSLRQAIIDANEFTSGGDSILIGADLLIQPTTPLPAISTQRTSIAAFGEGVVLDGSLLDSESDAPGLRFDSNDNELIGVTVVNFPGNGVEFFGDNNAVLNCRIGNNGTTAQPNGSHGVYVEGSNSEIGRNGEVDRNIISGNAGDGVRIQDRFAKNTQLVGNRIGTDDSGLAAVPNLGYGIRCDNCVGLTIGGRGDDEGNLLSGNRFAGVYLRRGSRDEESFLLEGNFLGTDATGLNPLGNDGPGIEVNSDTAVIIGGSAQGGRNVIAGNSNDGVRFSGGSNPNDPHLIEGNHIGVGVDGETPIPNTGAGVNFADTDSLILGNVISGNGATGVIIRGGGPERGRDNLLVANYIGTTRSGASVGNGGAGIALRSEATGNQIGGTTLNDGNIIAFNETGIHVEDVSSENKFSRNSIYGNLNSGILLDPDANGAISLPVLNPFTDSLIVSGTSGFANYVEVFVDDGAQGKTFVEGINVGTGGPVFTGTVDLSPYEGKNVTATTTDLMGNTSEFTLPMSIALGEGEGGGKSFHSADQDLNWVFDLAEVLRVIQLYNAGGYSCAAGVTEDGYDPGGSLQVGCDYHSGDYAPQDWLFSLSELLRIIQLFNAGQFLPCESGEDKFCPGSK